MPNRFLASLSPEDLARLGEQPVEQLRPGQVIARAGDPMADYLFIEWGFVSSVITGPFGHQIDVGMIGPDGFVGASGFFISEECPRALFDYVVRVPTSARRVSGPSLRQAAKDSPAIRRRLRRLSSAATKTNALNALCQAQHNARHRCARWWLTIRDGTGSQQIPVTQTTLAAMLGVTRQHLTPAYRDLTADGIVSAGEGRGVTILDVPALTGMASDCYAQWRAIIDAAFG